MNHALQELRTYFTWLDLGCCLLGVLIMFDRNKVTMRTCTALTGIASSLLFTGIAQAQSTGGDSIESVIVTGSRIARDGYNTPTPVSVLSSDEIQAEAPGSVADFVMTLPSIQGSTTASTSSGSLSSGQAGIAALNLRALGAGRTLVLFDGQRSVASTAVGRVDTNTFPQSLVERVEVVSGGASAAYGSDAIAGVVNFILDRDYTGFKTQIDVGSVDEYDANSERFVVTAGTDFGGGQGHILFSGETYNQDGIHYTTPGWAKNGYFGIPNPAYGGSGSTGEPQYIVQDGIGISTYTPGGLIVDGPLRGTYFGDGGSVEQLTFGDIGGQWMVGGDYEYTTSGMLGTNSLRSDEKRDSLFGRASWQLTSEMEVYAQGSYAAYEGDSFYINPTDRNFMIQNDNAFLPTAVRQSMADAGITSFRMSTSNQDFPASGSNNVRETTRFVLGLDSSFELGSQEFEYSAYYQRGITNTDEHQNPTWFTANLRAATDAIVDPTTGDIVCRSDLAGCVPINRFGTGVVNQDGLDFVLGRPRREQDLQQDVAAINFTTGGIEGWAGDISLAFGAEWREETLDGFVDPKFNSGWKYGNYKVTEGEYDVAEAYVETVVPVISDMLEFNGAVRYTDYSTSGGATTWKGGLTFTPIDDVTVRVTQSKDIRAPNLSELFDAGTARSNSVAIGGASTPFVQNLQGTPTVGPEEADAFGFGVVYQPSFLPGLALSVDYYDIEVDGVIGFLGAQDVADACLLQGRTEYCDNLRYDGAGVLQFIDLEYENLTSLISEGYDIEASYNFALGDLIGNAPGDISLRYLATNYVEDTTDDGVTTNNRAGENIGSTPDWVHRFTARYSLDTWSFNLTGRGHSDGLIDNDFIECSINCPVSGSVARTINENDIDGEWFFDLYAAKDFSFGDSEAQVFLSVKNMFDTDPVLYALPLSQGSENRPAYLPTNRNLMDVLGRTMRLGVRMEF
ncbi:MAG: iron complex outermembrane receptor protein [Cyclobacteriaceae bacterium]|jgi:iron complex outermembrane receptor protein